ncbi:hypothetical protein L6452_18217 [Arctium lappa]|uniref:Uncharacterized protein n=1 Tax=Arctium lappa TaxID=4217 RepID=A0ACB9C5G0_ARCLA|nr:hypothetical protein L6452_18217 [Arctium lappa]
MEPDLQNQHENMGAFDMIEHLKFLFQEQARHERYETSKELFRCRMSEGSPVGTYMLKMIGHIERLEGLGFSLRKELAIVVVLQSLPNSYSQFVMNYNMHDFEKSLPELLNMLQTAEKKLAKNKSTILMVRKDKKRKGKGKNVHELKRTRRLSKGEVDLRVGNGAKVAAIAVGSILAITLGIVASFPQAVASFLRLCHMEPAQTPQLIMDPQSDVERQPDVITQSARISSRKRNELETYGFLITHTRDVMLMDDEPTSYQDAMASTDFEKWLDAMRIEMDSMYENQVWNLTDPPNEVRPIACKWVFKKKTGMDVTMIKSIRSLPAIAAYHDYEIWQMDVKTAFLNGKLLENVYMIQPEGFVTPEKSHKCPTTSQKSERMSTIPYGSAIGSIMYAMICTRPDVSYALSMTSRYQSSPGDGHWIDVKNILKYLRRTKDSFLVYGGEEEFSVKGYTDASFQTDKDDFGSQLGFVFCINGGDVSWKSSKKATVPDSTTEAEYIAASDATKEVVWIKKFISQLGVVPSSDFSRQQMFIAESKTKLLNKEKSTSDLMRISVKQRQLYLYAKEHEESFSDR